MLNRDDFGPFFARDMARLVGLPDDASLDEIAKAVKQAVKQLSLGRRCLERIRNKTNWRATEVEAQINDLARRGLSYRSKGAA